jgi:hypothetical protein
MTERTPSQVNASLDNAWALIQELQSANRAHVRAHADLCLRVSQNHDRHEKDLAALKAEPEPGRGARLQTGSSR